MSFPTVLVSVNCTFSSNVLSVQVAGYYYVEVVAHAGATASTLQMDFYDNTGTLGNRLYVGATVVNLSRSVPFMIHLTTSNTYHLYCGGGTLDGNGYNGISFQGFLLYPAGDAGSGDIDSGGSGDDDLGDAGNGNGSGGSGDHWW